jgi:hypothetical protein
MTDSIIQLVTEIHKDVKDLDRKLTEHMTSETTELAKAMTELMSKAFPAGDPEGHRHHHEAVIKQAEEKAKFWQEMRIAGAKWAGLGVLGFLVLSAWQQFLKGPQ